MDERESILIVDDDESTRRSLTLIFEKKGYETETAGTGREAIEQAQGRFFNLALLDIRLSDVAGVELVAPLKERHPDMVVIIVTAYASLETAVRALNYGASAYITKPLNMDAVLATVGEALEKQRLVMENRRLFQEAQRELAERKRAEEVIKASLQEKEVLLKEIYHRVKNNLQVVASLLYLQSKTIQDEKSRELLSDSRNRIKSMALVHETLYQSEDLSRINFVGYTQNLIAHLFRSYGGSSRRITSKVNVSDVSLSIEAAMPCGLIINELVSNSLKYAFPERTGEIRIEMSMDHDDRFVLVVSDNGVGFPKDADFRETGLLGLKLVHSLVDQLDGTIELQNDEGTTFKIIFTEPEYTKRM